MKPIFGQVAAVLIGILISTTALADDEQEIRAMTGQFCKAMVEKNLNVIDEIFDPARENIYYDINEGPLAGVLNLKRVWRAATTNYTIARFDFTNDMKISAAGSHALQTGKWQQTQLQKDGSQRDIVGRATILWKKTPAGWRVYHYHASITPRGR